MTRDLSRENYEDQVIAVGDKIRNEAYEKAQAQWYATPDADKKRPWPRCKSLECNRSLNCIENTPDARDAHGRSKCQGFDF